MDWAESAEAIAEVDELLAQVGLDHGRRKTRAGAGKRGEQPARASKSALEPPKTARPAAGRMVPVVRAALRMALEDLRWERTTAYHEPDETLDQMEQRYLERAGMTLE